MNVPFLDLRSLHRDLQAPLQVALERVAQSGSYVLGPELEAFESEFAAYCGARHCVGVGNGSEAIELCLRAYEIGPGDEVIVPANTFIATWLAVTHVGAIPVPVEANVATYNIDPARIEAAITPRTRAIVAVHLYGHPANIDEIKVIAARHDLALIEDAAQAHGARYKGRAAGSLAHAAAFSFYPGKNLGSLGDGGAIVTDDGRLARSVRKLRNLGCERKYHHDLPGRNSRLDEMQAAVLRVKLPHLDRWNARRREVAARYAAGLAATRLVLPPVASWAEPAWHLYVVRHPRRDALREHLQQAGIGTHIHYPAPPHRQPCYREAFGGADLPIALSQSAELLSLPMCPMLTEAQCDQVVDAVASFEVPTERPWPRSTS